MSDTIEKIRELQKIDQTKKDFLKDLIHEFANKQDQFFAQKVKMGIMGTHTGTLKHINSYIVSHKVSYVGNFLMGSQLPGFERLDEKGEIIIDDENVGEITQRAPDWSRQLQLTTYLLKNPNHKFTTILAIHTPPWTKDPNHENWEDGRALKDAIEFEPLDNEGKIGLLNLSASQAYALDGQHRIMGIKGVKEVNDGKFVKKNKAADIGTQLGEIIANTKSDRNNGYSREEQSRIIKNIA